MQQPNLAFQPVLFENVAGAGAFLAPPRYLVPCKAREAFAHEHALERVILRDAPALQLLEEIVGTRIFSVANQVRTRAGLPYQADIVIYDRSGGAAAVVELMLGELDTDHLYRGLLYAVNLRAAQVVLVASSFPNRTWLLAHDLRSWLQANGVRMKIHLIKLETFRARAGGHAYQLVPLAPLSVVPERAAQFLNALSEAVSALGDESLAGRSIADNRKLESYQGLGEHNRICIYAGKNVTRISLRFKTTRLRKKVLRKRVPERLAQALRPYGLLAWTKDASSQTCVGFEFPTPAVTRADPCQADVLRIAKAYAAIRAAVLAAIGDPGRRVSPQRVDVEHLGAPAPERAN